MKQKNCCKEDRIREEKEELKIYNDSLTGKVENQNNRHNARKEGINPIRKQF